MQVIRVISDLFFSAKVSETCRVLGLECGAAKSKDRLEVLLAASPCALVIVDLGLSGGIGPMLAGYAVNSVGSDRVFAFYSHVAAESLQAAHSLGVKNTHTRSGFFEELPNILSQHAAPPTSSSSSSS